MNTHIVILLILLLIAIIGPLNVENFYAKVDTRPRPNHRVQVGTLHNSPKEVNDLMGDLNKTGGQMVADTEYDDVDERDLNAIKT